LNVLSLTLNARADFQFYPPRYIELVTKENYWIMVNVDHVELCIQIADFM
jgi:hypothetical protein